MAKVYYNRIKAGKITIDQVPLPLRAKVQEMLDEDAKRLDLMIAG